MSNTLMGENIHCNLEVACEFATDCKGCLNNVYLGDLKNVQK